MFALTISKYFYRFVAFSFCCWRREAESEEIFTPFFPRGFPNVYTVMPPDYDYHSNEIGDYIKTVSSVSKSNCKHSGYNTKLQCFEIHPDQPSQVLVQSPVNLPLLSVFMTNLHQNVKRELATNCPPHISLQSPLS